MSAEQPPQNPDHQPAASQTPARHDGRREALEQLLDLAQDASSYLRRNSSRAVRASAALLLAASLSACSPDAPEEDLSGLPEPLAEEVRTGLPSAPGRYQLRSDDVNRDEQGIYHFAWRALDGSGGWNQASTSLAQLMEDSTDQLELPSEGGDPILHLTPQTPVGLIAAGAAGLAAGAALGDQPAPAATTTPGSVSSSSSGSSYSRTHWFPFFIGSPFPSSVPNTQPAYRNPPSQPLSETGTVSGSHSSVSKPSTTERVFGLSHGVSGQSGGTGRGTAATMKSGASVVAGKSGGSGTGGAASAKSGGFSGGGGGFFGGSGG